MVEGRIVRKFHIVEGLEKAPGALPLLFTGGNTGKLFVPMLVHFRFSALTRFCRVVHVSGSDAKF